jgi:hypothetical protein
MSRHPLDQQTAGTKPRPQQFDPVAQGEQPSPATRDLQRRARTKGPERLKHFARIERTGTED